MTSSSTRARYARVARFYDLLDWPFEPLYRPGRAQIGAASVGRTLELGAGTGQNFRHYGPSAHVFAADLSWAMLARARRRARLPIRGLLVADAAALPLPNECVDTVTATFVCCVQADPRGALAEIRRVLRPGGRALFLEYVLPPAGALRRFLRLLEPPLQALYGVRWEHELAALLPVFGLAVQQVRPVWRPLVVAILAAKLAPDDDAAPRAPA